MKHCALGVVFSDSSRAEAEVESLAKQGERLFQTRFWLLQFGAVVVAVSVSWRGRRRRRGYKR